MGFLGVFGSEGFKFAVRKGSCVGAVEVIGFKGLRVLRVLEF